VTEHLIDLQYLLEHSRPSSGLLHQVQDAFLEREQPNATIADIREMRAIGIEDVFTEWYGPRTDPLTPAANARWAWQPRSPLRPWIARQATQSLVVWKQAADAARQPWPAKIGALREIASRQPDPSERRVGVLAFSQYLVRGIGEEGVVRDAVRLVHVRAAQAAIAIERCRRDRGGAAPPTLQELVPAYLSSVPSDPFTGALLKLVVSTDRYVVYSAGPDQKDDGGKVGPVPTQIWKVTTPDVGLEIRLQQQ